MNRFRTRGHPRALVFIERAIERQRPPHALLLLGPEHVGKTTLALDLASGLLCLADDPARRPCRACAACLKIEHGNHPDVHLLAPQGAGQQIRVAQVQELATELALLPVEGRYRVAIVERAQRLNVDAQNSLLKTLEEPPSAVTVVLAADDSAQLLPTVVSRCARIRLSPVAPEPLAELMIDAEAADAARATVLGRLSGGCPGLALALARQPDVVVTRARLARTLLALLGADRRRRLAVQAELLEDGAALAEASRPAAERDRLPAGERPRGGTRPAPAERRAAAAQVIAVWRDVARDLSLAARGGGQELVLRDLVDELRDGASGIDQRAIGRFLARLHGLAQALESYANPDLVLDVLLLAWPTATPAPAAAAARPT